MQNWLGLLFIIFALTSGSLPATDREPQYSTWAAQELFPWFQSQPDQFLTSKVPSAQPVQLRYKSFLIDAARPQVVIVHGYGERIEKLMEIAFDFHQADYNVYLYDQRGYGRSTRINPEGKDSIYVDEFVHYKKDLEQFLTEVVGASHSKPTFLFAHSMGGLVSALLMHDRPDLIAGAVLSAPMFSIQLNGVPRRMALLLADVASALGFGSSYAFGQVGPRQPEFNDHTGTGSRPRWQAYADFYSSPEEWPYALGGASFHWLGEAVRQSILVDDEAWASQLKTPVLLFQAENDTFVSAEGQDAFCSRAPRCRKVFVPGTRHEIYREQDAPRAAYLKEIWKFLDEQLNNTTAAATTH
ncbi:alpha/beta fold hydrolase [Oligoflexus tunisiensis]|uniref:alpha/beta fold hydrolase n=1 Tax=Oligoflexus tunisiensis TaxID=708132 RepID=UPI00114CC312|nr:alpha/beta hydrolase [Oligoflexus tunisiensis]